MATTDPKNIHSTDTWVKHPKGRIFVRIWTGSACQDRDIENTPIVLFHDSLGCVDLWREFPAQLAAATGRTVIAYDRLGFGRSDPRVDVLLADFVANEATDFFPVIREQLNIRKFIAFGHSVGGGMAIHCAAKFVEECDALITESAQAFTEICTVQAIATAKEQFKDETQLERLKRYHGEKARWVVDAWTETWLSPAFASWSLANVLPAVKCPVLAIHGEHDEYGSNRHPEMIGQLCGGQARVEIIADTYHVPHRERPELVISMMSAFLTDCKE